MVKLTTGEKIARDLCEMDSTIGNVIEVDPVDVARRIDEAMLELCTQLAAEQLNNKLLREALNTAADKFHDYAEYHSMKDQTQDNIEKVERNLSLAKMCDEALTLPQDTTALEAMIAEAGEVMRERCAAVCDEQYPYSVFHTDVLAAKNCAAAIRKLGEQ